MLRHGFTTCISSLGEAVTSPGVLGEMSLGSGTTAEDVPFGSTFRRNGEHPGGTGSGSVLGVGNPGPPCSPSPSSPSPQIGSQCVYGDLDTFLKSAFYIYFMQAQKRNVSSKLPKISSSSSLSCI